MVFLCGALVSSLCQTRLIALSSPVAEYYAQFLNIRVLQPPLLIRPATATRKGKSMGRHGPPQVIKAIMKCSTDVQIDLYGKRLVLLYRFAL